MGDALKANFEAYVVKMTTEQEPEEETKEQKDDDFDIFADLKTKNGKTGDQIFSTLLNKVFDEDTSKVEDHLVKYLMSILEKGLLT